MSPVGRGRPEPTLTWIGAQQSSADQTSYTFTVTSPQVGLLVIGAMGRSGGTPTITSIEVNGYDRLVSANPVAAGSTAGVASAVVPAGDATVVVTFSEPVLRCLIGAWVAQRFAGQLPIATGFYDNTSSGTSIPLSMDTVAPSFSVFLVSASIGTAYSWSGATVRADIAASEGGRYSWADTITSGIGNTTVSATATLSSAPNRVGSCASW